MIRKHIPSILLICLLYSPLSAQDNITIDIGMGYYLRNSENGLNIMYDKKYREFYMAGLAFEFNNISDFNLLLEYNFQYLRKNNIHKFESTDANGNVFGDYSMDIALVNHYLDIDLYDSYSQNFILAWGPSFVLTHRIIEISNLPQTTEITKDSFYDRLASLGVGLNGLIEYNVPISTDMSFVSKIKLRYSHSIWFDEGIRKLDDYNQEFFTAQLTIGVKFGL